MGVAFRAAWGPLHPASEKESPHTWVLCLAQWMPGFCAQLGVGAAGGSGTHHVGTAADSGRRAGQPQGAAAPGPRAPATPAPSSCTVGTRCQGPPAAPGHLGSPCATGDPVPYSGGGGAWGPPSPESAGLGRVGSPRSGKGSRVQGLRAEEPGRLGSLPAPGRGSGSEGFEQGARAPGFDPVQGPDAWIHFRVCWLQTGVGGVGSPDARVHSQARWVKAHGGLGSSPGRPRRCHPDA